MTKRRTLPYARALGRASLVYVFYGPQAWRGAPRCEQGGDAVLLPPEGAPSVYDWRFVAGRQVVGFECGEAVNERVLALEILRAGARLFYVSPARRLYDPGGAPWATT